MKEHEVEIDADETKKLCGRIRLDSRRIEIEQAVFRHRFLPQRRENFKALRLQNSLAHQIGFLIADDGNCIA